MSGFNLEMMRGVNSLGNSIDRQIDIGSSGAGQPASGKTSGVTFAELLSDQLQESNDLIKTANTAAEELVSGKSKDLHGAMISLEKADISYRMLMQVRNKMIDAYREIMRMQV